MDKFVAPQLNVKAFTCPHCHVLAQMEYDTHNFRGDISINSFVGNAYIFQNVIIAVIKLSG